MRDIKAPNVTPLPEEEPTPEPSPSPKPRFTGSKVPVSRAPAPITPEKKNSGPTEPFARTPLNKGEVQQFQKKQPQRKPGRPPSARFQVGHRERIIVGGLLALALVVGGLAALIFWPSARIELLLRTAPLLVEQTLPITAETGTAGAVPGSVFFREVRVEGTAPVEGRQFVGERASGTVTIINRTTEEQRIVAESRLVDADGALYFTQSGVTVPAGSGGTVGAASVAVEADEAGPQGNLEAGTRLNFAALDASAQSVVYAEAQQGLAGGSGEQVSVVTADDLTSAREAAGVLARERVEGDVRSELLEGWTLLDESWTVELGDFETPATEGEQIAEVPFTAQARVMVMGYELAMLESTLRQALKARLDEEYVLFPGAISYAKTVQNVDWEAGRADVSVRVTHTTMPDFSLETLRTKLAGRSREEAQQYLEGLPGVQSVTVELSPFWVRSIPRVERRITIELTPDRQP